MSAAAVGESLLREVKEEGLDSLLRSLRELEPAFRSNVSLRALGRLLDVFQNPPITRQQQQYNHTQSSAQHQTNHPIRVKPPQVIEIVDATSCYGKTQLLYHLVATSLLPPKHEEFMLEGKSQAVVLVDLSSRFSILRLHDVINGCIKARARTSTRNLASQEIASLVHNVLAHLHIFRPNSSPSFLATLESLPSYLLTQPSSHFSADRPLGLLAVNDLSTFLWQDRFDAEEDAGNPVRATSERQIDSPLVQTYRSIVASLRHIQTTFSCIIVATNWGLNSTTQEGRHQILRPHMPAVWNNFCAVRVVVERDRVSKFRPGMSAEEAAIEGPQRWEAVENSTFSGWLNWWGSEGWREEAREGLRALHRGGRFSFRVTDDDVIVEDKSEEECQQ